MINDVCRRLSKSCAGVVGKGHNTGIRDLFREEVSQPERLGFGMSPGRKGIAAEAMHGHDAALQYALAGRLDRLSSRR